MVTVMSADTTGSGGRSTSDRLTDSAITLIARDGLDALSVRRVAAEASLSGGTVQHHFPTKAHLTVAAFDRAVRRQTERVAVVPRGEQPLVEHFIAQLCAILPDGDPSVEEAIVWIAMSAAVPTQPVVAERQRRAVATTRQWIQARLVEARTAGEIAATLDPAEVAPLIEAALDGMMQQIIVQPELRGAQGCRRLTTMIARLLRIDDPPVAGGTDATRYVETRHRASLH